MCAAVATCITEYKPSIYCEMVRCVPVRVNVLPLQRTQPRVLTLLVDVRSHAPHGALRFNTALAGPMRAKAPCSHVVLFQGLEQIIGILIVTHL